MHVLVDQKNYENGNSCSRETVCRSLRNTCPIDISFRIVPSSISELGAKESSMSIGRVIDELVPNEYEH
jgi:hypothetical protein